MSAPIKQRLVLSILDFLQDSIKDGTVKQDDQESLEVASASLDIQSQATLTMLTKDV